jgi:hypothetical protein
MKKGTRIIRRGPLNGKKIELAPTTGIEGFVEIYEEFIKSVFDLEPGEYLITDESSLHDFIGMDEIQLSDIHNTVQELYAVDVSDIKNGNLLEIFKRIHDKKSGTAQ